MTRSSITLRSLAHYWRWHLGLFMGVLLTAAVISGSLITGDSVRATLARQAELRLGKIAAVAAAADGFFTEALAERVRAKLPLGAAVEPVLYLQGSASESGAKARASGVNIYGVSQRFFDFSLPPPAPPHGQEWEAPPPRPLTAATGGDGGLYINRALAAVLGARAGTKLLLRFEKPGFISRDAPLSGESDQTVTQRIAVKRIVRDEEMGTFSLGSGQGPALNAWVSLPVFQEWSGMSERANLLLSDHSDGAGLEKALDESLTIEDAGLTLVGEGERHVLGTSRIFLADEIVAKVRQIFPKAEGVLTYLVNEIHANGKLTPYSFATAAESAVPVNITPLKLASPNWIKVSQWLADDLELKEGDKVKIKFFRVTRARNLKEEEAELQVQGILPMTDPIVRSDWTPRFPGIMEAKDCRDWKPGFDIKQDIMRAKDNDYWQEYKGTPKLWMDLNFGRELWGNRFGSLTSFLIPAAGGTEEMSAKLAAALTPAEAGLAVVSVKESAAKAVRESMDFGMLFASMSSFLIAAALLLAALLFVFGIEQRARQCGVLRATGWTGKQVRGLFLREAFAIAVPAAALGSLAGLLYAQWTLGKLERDWADAALGMRFYFTLRPLSLAIAAAVTLVLAAGVVWWAARRLLKAQPRELLAGSLGAGSIVRTGPIRRILHRVPTGCTAVLAAGMLAFTPKAPQHIAPMLFFGAAFLLLVDGLRVLNWSLRKMEAGGQDAHATIWSLGVRSTTRRRGRSLALAGLLALGIFMVTALNAFRQDARLSENTRASGAGGFAFVGESTLPVYEDLNSPAGQRTFDFEPEELTGVKFVPFRVRDGEEASCLNLNRAQTPRVMGLNAAAISEDAFSFASAVDSKARWMALEGKAEEGIPAIMDQYSAMFALGKNQGDIITVPDGNGASVKLKIVALLAGSVLQGNVVIGEEHFVKLYPDTKGYRYFLVDVPAGKEEAFRKTAVQQLGTRDFALTPAVDRLAQFQAVQNTYLTIFSTLGGLALLLSTVGLGVLVARNVMERRAEFAVLSACGFMPRQLRLMVLAEHWFLFFAAIVLGAGTALLAVWPNLKLAGACGMPVGTLVLILTGLLAGGLVFCWLAARLSITRHITSALRYE